MRKARAAKVIRVPRRLCAAGQKKGEFGQPGGGLPGESWPLAGHCEHAMSFVQDSNYPIILPDELDRRHRFVIERGIRFGFDRRQAYLGVVPGDPLNA